MNGHTLDVGGQYQWRADGEYHLFNPQTIHKLQKAVPHRRLQGVQGILRSWSNDQSKTHCDACAACWISNSPTKPIPIEEVEPVEAIVKRFKTGAMSYGSISKEAHEALAIAMNRIGGKSNTGEGGEDPARYVLERQRRFEKQRDQAGRFGTFRRDELLSGQARRNCRSRWRRAPSPAKAASCPARKVYPWIAKVRHSTPGVGLISPPPHHDIYSIEDLARADPRSEERQSPRAHQREAGFRSRRRHDRRGRGQRRTPTWC